MQLIFYKSWHSCKGAREGHRSPVRIYKKKIVREEGIATMHLLTLAGASARCTHQ